MTKLIFTKKEENGEIQIFLDNMEIDNYIDMLNIILYYPKLKYELRGFTKEEIKLINIIVKSYDKVLSNFYKTNHLTIATHNIKYKETKYYYLDSHSLGDKIINDFKSIDKIIIRKSENRYIVVVEGSVYLYGIKNEQGFYDIDNDNFITIDELESAKSIVLDELRNQDALHYVKRRIR